MTVAGGLNEEVYFLTFINAETKKRVDLPLDKNIRAYFWWPDSQHFGLLSNDLKTIYQVDLSSGMVVTKEASGNNLRFLDLFFAEDYPPQPLIAWAPLPDANDFFLIHAMERWKLSGDGRYYVPDNTLKTDPFTKVEDLITGKTFRISYPEYSPEVLDRLKKDNAYIMIKLSWSPVAPLLSTLGETLRIYDLKSERLVGAYQNVGDEGLGPDFEKGVQWSSDGTRLLYKRGTDDYSDVPCIFTLQTGKTNCLDDIRIQYGNNYIGHYKWTVDGHGITYVYYTHAERSSNRLVGLCQMDLASKSISCPTDGIPELSGQYIINYSYSLNGRYIAIVSDATCPGCDFWENPILSMISTEGNGYTIIGETIGDSWDDGFLWWKP